MSDFWYNIEKFNWDIKYLFFEAKADDLVYPGYSVGFPNQAKQFFIINRKTSGFRRFRLERENESEWLFKSEDDISCVILKNKV